MLGFKQSPPPYLAIMDRPAEFFYGGVNYASGGSGILDTTGNNALLSLKKQIADFKETVESIVNANGKQHADEFLSETMFMFLTGTNDMFGFKKSNMAKPLNGTQKEKFVSSLAETLNSQLKRVHELGGRKFAVVGTSLLGRVPIVRILSVLNPTFAENMNDLSWLFNVAVKAMLADLSAKLEGMEYSLTNSYQVFEDIIANPQYFGHTELKSPCCGGWTGGASPTRPSARTGMSSCSGTTLAHPTEKTYRLVAKQAYSGSPLYATPVNIQQLAGTNNSLKIDHLPRATL